MDSEIESTISGYSTDSMRSYRIFVKLIVFLFIYSYLMQNFRILLLIKKKKKTNEKHTEPKKMSSLVGY